jgi:site-specific DNA recombinase
MKAGIYCRVSTIEQNAENQEQACREYCARNGIDVYRVYKDDGVSGAKTSRPAFNELLNDMRHYHFNCVVVTKLDRMGRSLSHILSLFVEFDAKGVNFIAITQNIDTTTSAGRLQMQIIAAFAEFERNIISERTKEGLRYAQNVGKRGRDRHPRKKRVGGRANSNQLVKSRG